MGLSLDSPIYDLFRHDVAELSPAMSRKLALALAGTCSAEDPASVTVEDLLGYFPMRYEDRSNLVPIPDLVKGVECSVDLVVRVSGGYRVGRNRSPKAPPLFIFEITAGDPGMRHRPVVIWWFVSGKAAQHTVAYHAEKFRKGTRFVAFGEWEWDSKRNTLALRLNKPDELEILPQAAEGGSATGPADRGPTSGGEAGDSDDLESDRETAGLATIHTGRRVPVYRKLGQFRTKRLREIVFSTLRRLEGSAVEETLPADILRSRKLIGRQAALHQIHFPPESSAIAEYMASRSQAHRRLIYEEFFWAAFALQLQRGERRREKKGAAVKVDARIRDGLTALIPFELTGAQRRVADEVFSDMQSDAPMSRLVQGDVGSGKTIIALMAMYVAAANGHQSVLMAPTEILAEQHLVKSREFFGGTPFRVELLVGSMKAAEKRRVREAVSKGEVQIVIGTHAVIQDEVAFRNLGLAVIDEQHRFGVLQRALLAGMGFNPDVLVMTATPIPRSLAMTVYGDLDVSVIDELPPGRTPVKTVVLGEDKREGVYKGIRREVAQGRQVYVVYPLIEESDKADLKAATAMYEELRDDIFPDLRVGLLHGKMKSDEKEAVMSCFKAGDLDVLVSTTVIEVGVDVPNASLMVIEHAERFGLSQLHQLRGRVGRGSEKSFCVLLTGDKRTSVAQERLGIMEKTNDGFRIAERDLELRGQGDILGTRQSGLPWFKIGNILRDLEILEAARRDAESYLTEKQGSPETRKLIGMVRLDRRVRLGGIG